ncbi:hypothetical protein MTY414_67530 [Mycolicibacterium mageritense]|nr:hypothetical protein MTY414_67530 [Mycolicibacterium mageritense]
MKNPSANKVFISSTLTAGINRFPSRAVPAEELTSDAITSGARDRSATFRTRTSVVVILATGPAGSQRNNGRTHLSPPDFI